MTLWLTEFWPSLLSTMALFMPVLATAHIVLNKRDVRGAIGWVGLVWLAPLVGVLLYVLLGVNRIQRQARALRAVPPRTGAVVPSGGIVELDTSDQLTTPPLAPLRPLATLIERVTANPLSPGNEVEMLVNGDQAYPAMLEAIEGAEHSVTLATYIFDNDLVGRRFVAALSDATRRGVEVRVLVDAAGSRYSMPSIQGPLRRRGIPEARFLPTWLPWKVPFFNLRNHRKTLIIDGQTAFTGGMNIRQSHELEAGAKHPVRDTHFRIGGPVVSQLQEAFAQDWFFSTGETLSGEPWFWSAEQQGTVLARAIVDGPDEDFEKMRWAFLGALACALRTIRIVTPYFLPDDALLSAIEVAALRGVDVTIVVPERSNIRVIDWAMWPSLGRLLDHGCRIVLSGQPFDHSKLLVVDDCWVLFGSANWDPRSLRLNFELGVECFDAALGQRVAHHIDRNCEAGRVLVPADVDGRPMGERLRNGVARLLSPYL